MSGTWCCNWQRHFWNLCRGKQFFMFFVFSVGFYRKITGVSLSLCERPPILSKLAVIILLIFYLALHLHTLFFRNLTFFSEVSDSFLWNLVHHWLVNTYRNFLGISPHNLQDQTVKLCYLNYLTMSLGELHLSRLLVFHKYLVRSLLV